MGRVVSVVAAAALLALWIVSIAHNQPAVGPDDQSVYQQMTQVAGPTPTPTSPGPTPTPTSSRPTPTATPGAGSAVGSRADRGGALLPAPQHDG
ncbi:MAG TPA: hypothetical protein VJY65_12220 [Chloroflexota bacterium]|nr:hypothetical protein [Chloroflexota bacterium]